MAAPKPKRDDAELLLFAGRTTDELRAQLDAARASAASLAPLTELATRLYRELPGRPSVRAAVVAASGEEVARGAAQIESWLEDSSLDSLRAGRGVFLAPSGDRARIGFLFPGQGAPVHVSAGAMGDRVQGTGVHARAGLPDASDELPDDCIQLAVVCSSVAALEAALLLGIEADFGVGHSLGELTALYWAGAIDEPTLIRAVRARGGAMVNHARADGGMASLVADDDELDKVVRGADVTIACHNSPRQRAISGPVKEVERAIEQARAIGVRAMPLKVTGAFHSPLMRDAARIFAGHLEAERFTPLRGTVISTITGGVLAPDVDLQRLLTSQLSEPVQFVDAAREAARRADLLLEVGPGKTLAGLVAEITDVPTVSMRAGASSARGLLEAAGAAFTVGAASGIGALFGHGDGRGETSTPRVPGRSDRAVESREIAVHSNGVDLAVRETGSRHGRPIVLLHGLSATRNYVLMRSTLLERSGFRVIAYDARGHGRSSAPPSPDAYGYDDLLENLIAVIDALDVTRPLLVGASMGSHTALRLALECPDRVAALALVTPAYDSEAHPDHKSVQRGDRMAAALRRSGANGFIDEFEMPVASPTRIGAFRQALLRQLGEHANLGAVADALEHILRARPFGSLSLLGAVEAPALVVASHDQYDLQHPYEVAARYARMLPRARLTSEAPGKMPMAWNGAGLAKLVLALTQEASW